MPKRTKSKLPSDVHDQEELLGAIVGSGMELAKTAIETGEKLMEPEGSQDAAPTSLPQSVAHTDLVAASRKYGGW